MTKSTASYRLNKLRSQSRNPLRGGNTGAGVGSGVDDGDGDGDGDGVGDGDGDGESKIGGFSSWLELMVVLILGDSSTTFAPSGGSADNLKLPSDNCCCPTSERPHFPHTAASSVTSNAHIGQRFVPSRLCIFS
jgi:hypothetical protein